MRTIEAGTGYWSDPNTGATNESGFTGLPGGFRDSDGFGGIGNYGVWWSSTEFDGSKAWVRELDFDQSIVFRAGDFKTSGYSARCVKD